jgi:hypothetical protein
MPRSIECPSPDNRHKAVLTYLGKVHADQGSYSLSMQGPSLSFTGRIFGKVCVWSPDSRFLVVQEWKEIDEAGVPKFCQLLILDLSARRECVITNVEGSKGNILPESFIGDSLMYTVIYDGQFGMTKSFESRFQYLDGWKIIK